MTYKDKIEKKDNVNPFPLFRLVKEVILDNGNTSYSFYDGDYLKGFSDETPLFTKNKDDAKVFMNDDEGNYVLNKLVELIETKKIDYNYVFVNDYNELNEEGGYLLHYPSKYYFDNNHTIPFKIRQCYETRIKAINRLNRESKTELLYFIEGYSKTRNTVITSHQWDYLFQCDVYKLRCIVNRNRGRETFDPYIMEPPFKRKILEG